MRSPSPLALLRKNAGYTRDELAREINASKDAILRWEMGKVAPDLRSFMRLAFALGVDFQELGLALLAGPRRQRREDLPQPPKDWLARDCSRDRSSRSEAAEP